MWRAFSPTDTAFQEITPSLVNIPISEATGEKESLGLFTEGSVV